jgi:hypothetical protein
MASPASEALPGDFFPKFLGMFGEFSAEASGNEKFFPSPFFSSEGLIHSFGLRANGSGSEKCRKNQGPKETYRKAAKLRKGEK